ncbi:MAG: phosphotransferase [Candidatus Adiutrix sp.]
MLKSHKTIKEALSAWAQKILLRPAALIPLAQDGGDRQYFKLDHENLLAMHGPNQAENLAWLTIGRHLWFNSIPVPRIYHYDLASGFFILEYLGPRRLLDETPSKQHSLYLEAASLLARFHNQIHEFNPNWGYQTRSYNQGLIYKYEISYFLDCFLKKHLQWPKLPKGIMAEAKKLSRLALSANTPKVLIHRDYQCRNLMAAPLGLHIIDWQSARLGPRAYDLASLLGEPFGAPTNGPEIVSTYLKAAKIKGTAEKTLRHELKFLSVCRLMQALGAYGNITHSGKPGFTAPMKPAIISLISHLAKPDFAAFPLLQSVTKEAAVQLENTTCVH